MGFLALARISGAFPSLVSPGQLGMMGNDSYKHNWESDGVLASYILLNLLEKKPDLH